MHEIVHPFRHRSGDAERIDAKGVRWKVALGETVSPPGLYRSSDPEQISRLILAGCLDKTPVSHAADKAAPEPAAPLPAVIAAPAPAEPSAAPQLVDGAGAGSAAVEGREEAGSRADALADGDDGGGLRQRPEPDAGGRKPRRGGKSKTP